MSAASILRIAAFSDGAEGGNPAGVWIGPALPPEAEMQRLAHEVGFSEIAFAARQGEDMGMRSRLHAEIPDVPGSSIRVVGTARSL
jgi:predicted PhzF superfamily epimerase YddE/YHI9